MATLKERIKAQPEKTFLSIGAKQGFLWQGTKEEALEDMKNLDERIHTVNIRRIAKGIDAVTASLPTISARLALVKAAEEKHENEHTLESAGELAKCSEKLELAAKNSHDWAKYINKHTQREVLYVPMLSRTVIDEYLKTACDPGIAIIVSGPEEGNIWFQGDKN